MSERKPSRVEQTSSTSIPFGTSSAPPSLFGNNKAFPTVTFPGTFGGAGLNTSSPFGLPATTAVPMSSPFGASSSISSTHSPFGVTSATITSISSPTVNANFSGRAPREILLSFYQQHNPQKVSEVDKLLEKYKGNEEQMFRNLAKKYSLDPSVFGLPASVPVGFGGTNTGPAGAPTGGFGQISVLGGGPSFGTPNAPFGTSSVFGSTAPTPPSGFGSLAQSFASPSANSSSFGTSTPFGAARR
jgi:hypothetical protein